jgi:hypothetical protein
MDTALQRIGQFAFNNKEFFKKKEKELMNIGNSKMFYKNLGDTVQMVLKKLMPSLGFVPESMIPQLSTNISRMVVPKGLYMKKGSGMIIKNPNKKINNARDFLLNHSKRLGKYVLSKILKGNDVNKIHKLLKSKYNDEVDRRITGQGVGKWMKNTYKKSKPVLHTIKKIASKVLQGVPQILNDPLIGQLLDSFLQEKFKLPPISKKIGDSGYLDMAQNIGKMIEPKTNNVAQEITKNIGKMMPISTPYDTDARATQVRKELAERARQKILAMNPTLFDKNTVDGSGYEMYGGMDNEEKNAQIQMRTQKEKYKKLWVLENEIERLQPNYYDQSYVDLVKEFIQTAKELNEHEKVKNGNNILYKWLNSVEISNGIEIPKPRITGPSGRGKAILKQPNFFLNTGRGAKKVPTKVIKFL